MILAIETNKLCKSYGNYLVIKNLNLRVEKGDIHALIGSNGAGKTTTLLMLSGIIKPTSGSAIVVGRDMVRQSIEAKREIGYVPENPSLYESLTVSEFFEFVGKLYSVPRDLGKSRIEKYSNLLDINSITRKFIGSLSKGEQQRVLICSIMLREPQLYLLDEPFFALDPRGARTLREILEEKAASGSTILLATHQLEVAERLCNTFTIIEKGQKLVDGTLRELQERVGRASSSLEEIYLYFSERRGNG